MFPEHHDLMEFALQKKVKERTVLGAMLFLLKDRMTEQGITDFCCRTTDTDEDFIKGLMNEGLREFYKQYLALVSKKKSGIV